MNSDARFWDKRAEKYSQRPVGDQDTYEKKLEIMRFAASAITNINCK